MSEPIVESKFSLFKPFNIDNYTDTLFRNQPEGIRLDATFSINNGKGETITRTGRYVKDDKGRYEFVSGWNVIQYFWDRKNAGDPTETGDSYYADQVAYAFTAPTQSVTDGSDVFMQVSFTPAPKPKSAGAPF